MKVLALAVASLLLAASVSAADEFDYKTIGYPMSLLQRWEPENANFAGRYAGEYGDSGAWLDLIRYPTASAAGSPIRYSAIWVGPYAVATKPKIRVFEDLKVSDGVIEAKGLLVRFCQYKEPDSKKPIQGVLINGLFYEQVP